MPSDLVFKVSCFYNFSFLGPEASKKIVEKLKKALNQRMDDSLAKSIDPIPGFTIYPFHTQVSEIKILLRIYIVESLVLPASFQLCSRSADPATSIFITGINEENKISAELYYSNGDIQLVTDLIAFIQNNLAENIYRRSKSFAPKVRDRSWQLASLQEKICTLCADLAEESKKLNALLTASDNTRTMQAPKTLKPTAELIQKHEALLQELKETGFSRAQDLHDNIKKLNEARALFEELHAKLVAQKQAAQSKGIHSSRAATSETLQNFSQKITQLSEEFEAVNTWLTSLLADGYAEQTKALPKVSESSKILQVTYQELIKSLKQQALTRAPELLDNLSALSAQLTKFQALHSIFSKRQQEAQDKHKALQEKTTAYQREIEPLFAAITQEIKLHQQKIDNPDQYASQAITTQIDLFEKQFNQLNQKITQDQLVLTTAEKLKHQIEMLKKLLKQRHKQKTQWLAQQRGSGAPRISEYRDKFLDFSPHQSQRRLPGTKDSPTLSGQATALPQIASRSGIMQSPSATQLFGSPAIFARSGEGKPSRFRALQAGASPTLGSASPQLTPKLRPRSILPAIPGIQRQATEASTTGSPRRGMH